MEDAARRIAVLMLGSENRETVRFRELVEALLRDCDGERLDALLSAVDLGGKHAAVPMVAKWLHSNRRWIRFRLVVGPTPNGQDFPTRIVEGASFRAGVFYSVDADFADRLLREPESDRHVFGSARFVPVFVEEAPGDGAEVGFVW